MARKKREAKENLEAKSGSKQETESPTSTVFVVEARDIEGDEACPAEYVFAGNESAAILRYLKWFPERATATLKLTSKAADCVPADARIICVEQIEDKDIDGNPITRTILKRARLVV